MRPTHAVFAAATLALGITGAHVAHADPEPYNFVIGTNGPDVLAGTRHADWIVGRNGNDRITGRGGADVLRGGNGNDRLFDGGDHRRDVLRGGPGTDLCSGGANDVFVLCETVIVH